MADDPTNETVKTDLPSPNPAPESSSISPDEPKTQVIPADPLADGTLPTVLNAGTSHISVAKGRASISSIYRKADILTTILTFVGALVAAGIIFGIYAFITRAKTSNVAAPKVTNLDKADLSKLSAFFDGNSAGSSTQVLTISSSSLFNNRVAVNSDLKVTGGVDVDGASTLGDLNVQKTSSLGVTNIRGALSVSGPLNLQSPAIFAAGATVNGNLATSGNGSFGGSLSAGILNVRDISVSGMLSINGHLNFGGQLPSVSPESGAGSGASARVIGNDSSGTAIINTGNVPGNSNLGGSLITITFRTPFSDTPHILITPQGRSAATLQPYIQKTVNGFTIGVSLDARSNTSYSFDYWVVQ